MERFILVIDEGTTSVRSILFSHDGAIVARASADLTQYCPRPGWVEHDPMEIWNKTVETAKKALAKGRECSAESIAAIGIANQRETTVVWNKKTGKPYGSAIVWQDIRTDAFVEKLAQGATHLFRKKTGLPLATYFSGPKIRWLLEHYPDAKKEAEHGDALFGTIDTWLVWNLTGGARGGVHRTDVTNASRTLLMNLRSLEWDEELCEAMDVPETMLPEVCASSDATSYGETSEGLFDKKIPIAGVVGDQQAALFGQTCFAVGDVKNTYGTGAFMLMNTGETPVESKSGLITTVAYKIGDQKATYALEGSIAIAGALVQWLRDNLGLVTTLGEIEALANTVEDNGGVYFVPAFSGLFAPYWRSDARGTIVGLTRYATKAHLARAALEAIAFQTKDVFDAMQRDASTKIEALRVDGGMTANETLMQFQADVLNAKVFRPHVKETTALGAAFAAGLAVGFWEDRNDVKQTCTIEKEWLPTMSEKTRTQFSTSWKKAVTKSFDWIEAEGERR